MRSAPRNSAYLIQWAIASTTWNQMILIVIKVKAFVKECPCYQGLQLKNRLKIKA